MSLPADHGRPRWRLEDIRFDMLDLASVRNDEFLFLTLAAASFVEILAGTYSANLVRHFRGNPAITRWLEESWQQEEVQHGRALKAYVQTVWPEFDWEGAHLKFQAAYAACARCTAKMRISRSSMCMPGAIPAGPILHRTGSTTRARSGAWRGAIILIRWPCAC